MQHILADLLRPKRRCVPTEHYADGRFEDTARSKGVQQQPMLNVAMISRRSTRKKVRNYARYDACDCVRVCVMFTPSFVIVSKSVYASVHALVCAFG